MYDFRENLGLKKLCSTWVPHLLTMEEKQQRLDDAKSCLSLYIFNNKDKLIFYHLIALLFYMECQTNTNFYLFKGHVLNKGWDIYNTTIIASTNTKYSVG